MTQDEREFAQASIEAMVFAIKSISRALMLNENEFPNAIQNHLWSGDKHVKYAQKWLDRTRPQNKQ